VDILLASQNPGKLAEMRHLVRGLAIEVVSPGDVGIYEAPEEIGASFLENAREKARHYGRVSRDAWRSPTTSGLSVDGGWAVSPGIYSARYGGPQATDPDAIA